MFDRFTDAARRTVVMAQEEARVHGVDEITTEHLLLGVLRLEADPAVSGTLSCADVTPAELYSQVDAVAARGDLAAEGNLAFTKVTKRVIAQSMPEAMARGDAHIGNEHLLLAIVAVGKSPAADVLERAGATHEAMRAAAGDAEAAPGFQVRTTKGSGWFRKGKG